MPKITYILAGDIGGTNSRFSLFRPGQPEPLHEHVYANEVAIENAPDYHHATLKPYLEKCLAEVDEWRSMGMDAIVSRVQVVACLATAGPVKTNNTVFMTNMGKVGQAIDGNEIEKCQDGLLSVVVRCKLVNDFVGQGKFSWYTLDFFFDSLNPYRFFLPFSAQVTVVWILISQKNVLSSFLGRLQRLMISDQECALERGQVWEFASLPSPA